MLEIVQIDAFTDQPFTGNPAAVCLLKEPAAEWRMQEIAREMNLSETAFLLAHPDGYDLRWFTPTVEVKLCGHATLASAHLLWESGAVQPDQPILFHTQAGVLTARKEDAWIELDFPTDPVLPIDPPEILSRALGFEPLWVGKGRFDMLVEAPDEKAIRVAQPNLSLLEGIDARGVIITSQAISPRFDFVSRYFAPRIGVPEDPVTGSAHCTLAEFWQQRLQKDELIGYQVSARGGMVRVRPSGERVLLAGRAVTVLRCELLV